MSRCPTVAGLLLAGLLAAACGSQPIVRPLGSESVGPAAGAPSEDPRVLAGEWEYEDGSAAYVLKFDERGNGTYAWKDGRFETRKLSDRSWQGKWFQRQNDREGGFEVTLSSDYVEGEGRWWYTRIGADYAPADKGGRFHLTRVTTQARKGETPATP